MKRFRLSTLLLLVAITALGVALVAQQERAARREAELRAKIKEWEDTDTSIRWQEMNERRRRRYGPWNDQDTGKRQAVKPRAEDGER